MNDWGAKVGSVSCAGFFTQGPRGWRGSPGSQWSRTSKREGEIKETEEEKKKQRWVEMGRMAGRQTVEV